MGFDPLHLTLTWEGIASKTEIHQYMLYIKEKLIRLVIEIELQVSNN